MSRCGAKERPIDFYGLSFRRLWRAGRLSFEMQIDCESCCDVSDEHVRGRCPVTDDRALPNKGPLTKPTRLGLLHRFDRQQGCFVRVYMIASTLMSVDLLHALMAGVFILVWLLVWQILVRGDGSSGSEMSETRNGESSQSRESPLWRSRSSRRTTRVS